MIIGANYSRIMTVFSVTTMICVSGTTLSGRLWPRVWGKAAIAVLTSAMWAATIFWWSFVMRRCLHLWLCLYWTQQTGNVSVVRVWCKICVPDIVCNRKMEWCLWGGDGPRLCGVLAIYLDTKTLAHMLHFFCVVIALEQRHTILCTLHGCNDAAPLQQLIERKMCLSICWCKSIKL